MSARILDGKTIAQKVRDRVAEDVKEFKARTGLTPGLSTILIGEDPASAVYVASKKKATVEAGMNSFGHELPADASREEVLALIDELNADPGCSGILCQLPAPDHLDPNELTNRIHEFKDVDGLTVASAGRLSVGVPGLRPCTPEGCMELIAEAGVDLEGIHAVVIGRSNLFGRPMAKMLLDADATVSICHIHSLQTAEIARQADVLVVATGVPGLVKADWVKPGATVIDVGITRTPTGLVGDVEFDAVKEVAGVITPVPGGVGPMTIACLMRNTLKAAELQYAAREVATV
jgi:methylenetetrahydrofolate dehydrogenase (NADP+)/methenyltetrahydrofolate cyclohydrolase